MADIASLMYHEVGDDDAGSGFQRPAARRYGFSLDAFAQHLAAIANPVRPPALISDFDPGGPGRHVLLTFDDGGRSALLAATELEAHGWRGHFFIVTDLIGRPTFLGAGDIRRLRARGHLVGSHSHTHPDIFPDLSRATMLAEWRTSREILEDVLGEPCVMASLPGGDLSPAVLETAEAAGYRYLFTSEPLTRPGRHGGMWVIGRYCMKRRVPPETAGALARFSGWTRARVERALKNAARKSLAPIYRAYVRRTTRARPVLTGLGA